MKQKASKIDYSKAMLPRTRKAQFLDCFRMNYIVLLKSGLMLLLFFIPLLGFSFFMDFYGVSLMEHAVEEQAQTAFVYYCLYGAGVVILSISAVIGLTGVIHVLRNLVWQEGIFFKDDFVGGIKQNAGKNVLSCMVFGVIFYGAFFIHLMFFDLIIALFPAILFAVVFLPIQLWMMFLNNTYESKTGSLIKNSLYFYIKTIGWSIVGTTMLLAIVALQFMPFFLIWLKYLILVLFIVFVFPIIVLIMNLYTTSRFDVYINKENYPDYFMRGLNHD